MHPYRGYSLMIIHVSNRWCLVYALFSWNVCQGQGTIPASDASSKKHSSKTEVNVTHGAALLLSCSALSRSLLRILQSQQSFRDFTGDEHNKIQAAGILVPNCVRESLKRLHQQSCPGHNPFPHALPTIYWCELVQYNTQMGLHYITK